MSNQTELQALQNFADKFGLTVHENQRQDKRKTVKKYFVTKDKTSISPVLGYEQLNCFLLGWNNCIKAKN